MISTRNLSALASFFLPLAAQAILAAPDPIEFQPNDLKPTKVILNSSNGSLNFYRKVWQAMNLVTADGKSLPVTDLFFYNSVAEGISGYWTDPKIWDAHLSFRKIPLPDGQNRPRTVLIEGSQKGLRKQVFATIYPDQPIVYVVNRILTNGKSIQVKNDQQLTWFPAQPADKRHASQVVLDGKEHPIDKAGRALNYAYFYLPNQDACLGIVFTPTAQQRLGTSVLLAYNVHENGREISLPKGGKTLSAGEMMEQRYAIFWSDGRKLDEVKRLAAEMAKREVNKKRFYPPPTMTYAERILDRKRKAAEAKINYEKNLWRYLEQASKTEWTEAKAIRIQNRAQVDDNIAVVVPVQAAKDQSFMVVDENGRPIVTQSDDLDGDSKADEVCFLLSVGAGKQRTVQLLSAEARLTPAPSDMRIQQVKAGSWKPVRMQPSSSPGTGQHSTYISPANSALARKIMGRLNKPVPMEQIECDDFKLLLGHTSGQIEGMRPANIPPGYLGSFLREFNPNESNVGKITRSIAGPVRCRFEWQTAGRSITVYRNGVIESKWEDAPSELKIIACAYPYRYLAAGQNDVVRYSQMPEMRREIPNAGIVSLFGRMNASLRIEGRGVQATEHQVWLDGGEIGWEAAIDMRDGKSDEKPRSRVGRLCADTYIAGGLQVTNWRSEAGPATIFYRISSHGEKARDASGLVRTSKESLRNINVSKVLAPEPRSPITIRFERTEVTVNRLHPNRINGWELRPVTLARHNPQPAYFAVELANRSSKEARIELRLGRADWIQKATLLSDREILYHDKNPALFIYQFQKEEDLIGGDQVVTLVLPPGRTEPFEICVYPKEETLGSQRCTVRWTGHAAGNADLEVIVKPTIMFMPNNAPASELGGEYSNVTREHAPLLYDYLYYGGPMKDRTRFYKAKYRDYERRGFWTVEHLYIRTYITHYARKTGPSFCSLEMMDWANTLLDLFDDPDYSDYLVRLYLHDEIWEPVGRSGEYTVPLSKVIDLDRAIVMNSRNAAWSSFMEPGIDKPYQYHIKLPNDIAELFYYCGRDERLHQYANKLIEPRRALFSEWCADPGFMAGAGTDKPRQLFSFWISTQMHVNKYTSIRRQVWWLRHHGIDSILSYAWASGEYEVYANRILHLMVLPASTPQGNGYLLTDRGLAWMDMKEDMELITLVRLLLERTTDKQTLASIDELVKKAFEASQRNDFESARHHYVTALNALRPNLSYLAPRDLYGGRVKAEPLLDLFEEDQGFRDAVKLPMVTLPLIDTGKRPAPSVDGILDNAYLEQGVTLEMRDARQGGRLEASTAAYLARDSENLYVIFNCNEPRMSDLRNRKKKRDSNVWEDDCVEIFVDRTRDGKNYAHIAVNAAGVQYDSRSLEGMTWNPDYRTAAKKDKKSWTAELSLPFQIFGGPPKPGERWRINFCRERKPIDELGAWSVTFGGFHTPERFGIVQFK